MSKYRFDQIAINSTVKKKPTEEDKYHYIGLEHIDSQNLIVSRWGSEIAPKGDKLLMKKGNVLFGKRRAYQKKVAIAPFDGIFSAHGMVLRPNEKVIDRDFFPMFISSDYFLDAAIAISVGSLSPTINWKDLARLEFDLPPREEQRKLAEVLWSINDTLKAYQNLLTQTDALVQAQFKEMFDNTDYPEKSGKELFKFSSGKFLPEEKRKEDGIPVYGGNGIAWYTDESLVNEDTIIIGRVGAYCGNVRLAKGKKWITDNAIYISKFKTQDFSLEFLENMMRLHNYHQYAGVAAQPKITQKPLEEAQFVIPPIAVQKEFSGFASQIEKSKSALQNTIASLQATKRCILENALGTRRKE